MSSLQSNIFPITNLPALSANYRLYKIRGLQPGQAEYYQNRHAIIRQLSFDLRSPVTVIDILEAPHLVLRDDCGEPPSPLSLVRGSVYFDRIPGTKLLNFTERNAENDEISLRFLQFMLGTPLLNNARLWQPSAGRPFFEKTPFARIGDLHRYIGFSVRAVTTPDGGIGLCVDVRNRFVGATSLDARIDRKAFREWRGRHFIYRYGHSWFEIQGREFADLNATEMLIPRAGGMVPLLQFIVDASRKPIPTELANLPHDCSVMYYSNNQRDQRAAPVGLCYPVFDTQSAEVQRVHHQTILRPHERLNQIVSFVRQYLSGLRFGNTVIKVADAPMTVERRFFSVPDYNFGGGKTLSMRGTVGAEQATLDTIGRLRLELLRDKSAGFIVTDPLQRQYLIMPQSVLDSFGSQYVADLRRAVDELFIQQTGFNPIVVPYDDRAPKTFPEQGKAILAAAKNAGMKPGYGLIMVHHTEKGPRQHDQLAAMLIRKFKAEFDVYVAINHSAIGRECYELARRQDGTPYYRIRFDKRGKLSGYLRNVALNKILLTNERWPFILATPLHADVTIGIDVKHNTAGFTIVGRHGTDIRTECHVSNQRERLMADQVKKYLVDIISKEAGFKLQPIQTIVIHRDGRMFDTELRGAQAALACLKSAQTVAPDATLTVLEISKTAPAPLRLFLTRRTDDGRCFIENPFVGTFYIAAGGHAYLCATGKPFDRAGTVQPLHVRHVFGPLSLEHCLEDLYFLTALTWTRPEDCSRYPITIKLNDRRLGEDADVYDTDALEFEEFEQEASL